MESKNQTDWPQKSDYGECHNVKSGRILLFSAIQMVLLISFFLCPKIHLLIANLLFWLFCNIYVTFMLLADHEMIHRLRRMYVDYFDYCVAQKRFIYNIGKTDDKKKEH